MPIAADGTAYELTGDSASPVVAALPVVVFIHGLGLNRQIWQPYAAAFSPTYRVLLYDLYGHGDSAIPPVPLSLAQFSQQLLNLLDELNIAEASVVGFSIGGMINRRLAMDAPQRVKSLVVVNSPHERPAALQQKVEEQARLTAADGITQTMVETTFVRWFTPEFRAAKTAYLAALQQTLMANNPQVFAQCRQILAEGVTELLRPQPPIATPTLVITAENDIGSTPQMAQAIAAEMQNAKLQIIPNLQHMGIVEDFNQYINILLQFINKIYEAK